MLGLPKKFEVQRVNGWPKNGFVVDAQLASQVQLNCPESILTEFKELIRTQGSGILGCEFDNPYTGLTEKIPENPADLTAMHLQILARIERANVTGRIDEEPYKGNLSREIIARIRCLVKATNIAGVVDAIATGGFYCPRYDFNPPQRVIIVDQAGFQWQDDFENTGGLFFYPNDNNDERLPENFSQWQMSMYQVFFGAKRPATPSHQKIDVSWRGVSGQLDLTQLTNALAIEFSQALDAVVSQGDIALNQNQRINFKFLKAGMGFFAAGLGKSPEIIIALEKARLSGILQVLNHIQTLEPAEKNAMLGKVKRITLPFSGSDASAPDSAKTLNPILSQIEAVTKKLGLEWGGTPKEDALKPCKGYVTATTNCADPHAMMGNEGGQSSVDASISTNTNSGHLNPAFNRDMQFRQSPFPSEQCRRIHLTQEMARAVYTAVPATQQPDLNNLNNEKTPDKIAKALEIVGVQYDSLTFKERDGYWITLSLHMEQHLTSLTRNSQPLVTTAPEKANSSSFFSVQYFKSILNIGGNSSKGQGKLPSPGKK